MPDEPLGYDSPAALQDFFKTLNISVRKFLGQNFLINRGVREKIISLLSLQKEDELWEIGPGLGAMTALAVNKVTVLRAFEIDHAYGQILEAFFRKYPSFHLIRGDVLKTFTQEKTKKTIKILGNLPYNIASAVIQEFIKQPFEIAVLLVQKELAQRMIATPREKNYSSFSVWCQCHFDIKTHGIVRPNSFYPAPRVDSMIISLRMKDSITHQLSVMLNHLLRSAFAARRKTLRNNFERAKEGRLRHIDEQIFLQACHHAGIDLQKRAEEYAPHVYLSCANYLLESCAGAGSPDSDTPCSEI